MKNLIISVLLLSLLSVATLQATTTPAIIPAPKGMKLRDGVFKLTPATHIYVNSASRRSGDYLADHLRKATGYPLKISTRPWANKAVEGAILLTTRNAKAGLGLEGYDLDVSPASVVIRAPKQAGIFYGIQSLLQLLPPEIFATQMVAGVNWQIPSVQIEDQPRFKWRGFMLDVSRHFYNKSEVETLLDAMALLKLNRFHWHLTDDQGWRIQIKKYPKLTEVGAWREHSRFRRPPKKGANAQPTWMEPTADKFRADGDYGGYYTPEDIRDVVAYAAERHITIVPEIEMPGHSGAALRAYPQFGCTDEVNGVVGNVYCPANPATFKFLDNVLSEVFQLFPGKYIHIGGDEVRKGYWEKSPECRALMKGEGLKNSADLQSWFTKRVAKFINAHGHTMIGWSEILRGGLASNAVVMDWIGGGKEAASEGHDVIMTPTAYCYFDYYQSTNHTTEPQAIGGYLPLKKVYSFEPIPKGLAPEYDSHILGAQANLWTEYVASLPHAEYMIFPRLCALSEVTWSPKSARDWENFQQRLKVEDRRLDELGINYRHTGGVTPESDVPGK